MPLLQNSDLASFSVLVKPNSTLVSKKSNPASSISNFWKLRFYLTTIDHYSQRIISLKKSKFIIHFSMFMKYDKKGGSAWCLIVDYNILLFFSPYAPKF